MGQASRKLAHRLRHSRRGHQGWRQQAKHDAVRIPTDVKNIQHLVEHEGYDPLHAAYIAAQNLLAVFAESVSTFDEFGPPAASSRKFTVATMAQIITLWPRRQLVWNPWKINAHICAHVIEFLATLC